MKRCIILLSFSLLSLLVSGQCKYQKTTRLDGTTVIQYETLPVAISMNNEVAFSISTNMENIYLAMVVRFKGMSPNKMNSYLNMSLTGHDIVLKPYKQQLVYIGNETVLQIIFQLSDAEQKLLTQHTLNSFVFKFEIDSDNERIRNFKVTKNASIIQQQLKKKKKHHEIGVYNSSGISSNQNNYYTNNRKNNQSENRIYIGETSYPSTNTWTFSNDYFKTLAVTVAIHPTTGGFLMLETSTSFPQEKISGTVLLYLANNTVIKCIDRGIKDHVNGKSIALYKFTEEEMEKLAQNRITSIRFSVRSNFSSDSYIVENVKSMLDKLSSPNSEDYYETEKEIKDLF